MLVLKYIKIAELLNREHILISLHFCEKCLKSDTVDEYLSVAS